MENTNNIEKAENTEIGKTEPINVSNAEGGGEYLDMFFTACEYSGEFWGKLSASIINNTSYYTQIGIEGVKKSHNKYMDRVKPAFDQNKEKIIKTIYKE